MADYKEKMSQSSEEAMRLKLLEEFKYVTCSQAYHKMFNILRKGVKEGIRRSVSQTLDNLLWKTLNLSDVPSPVRIMDFGGGTGELMMAISQKMEILHKELIISVEEPHKEYLDQYRMSINDVTNARLDVTYSGPLQDYYGHSVEALRAVKAYPQQLQDRVLAVHVLYHLTNVFDDPFDPYENMKQAISSMYAILKPEGEMVIVMDCIKDHLFETASLKCAEVLFPATFENHKRLYEIWQNIVYNGGIVDMLNMSFPTFKATMQHNEVSYQVVLPTIAEIGAAISISSLSGLCANQSPFDHRVVQFCMDYVMTEGYKHGLYLDSKGVWCFPLKTYYMSIKKEANK